MNRIVMIPVDVESYVCSNCGAEHVPRVLRAGRLEWPKPDEPQQPLRAESHTGPPDGWVRLIVDESPIRVLPQPELVYCPSCAPMARRMLAPLFEEGARAEEIARTTAIESTGWCGCGHSIGWHGDGDGGACGHIAWLRDGAEQACDCKAFKKLSPAIESATSAELAGHCRTERRCWIPSRHEQPCECDCAGCVAARAAAEQGH